MESKHWLKSKTIWFNAIMTAVGVVVVVEPYLPQQFAALSLIVQGVGNVLLRVWFTTQALTNTSAQVEEVQETVDKISDTQDEEEAEPVE